MAQSQKELSENEHRSRMSTDPNMSEQSGPSEQLGTQHQPTTMERMETNKSKIPILLDRETDLTKTNPRM